VIVGSTITALAVAVMMMAIVPWPLAMLTPPRQPVSSGTSCEPA
jgi:hypothetical protein